MPRSACRIPSARQSRTKYRRRETVLPFNPLPTVSLCTVLECLVARAESRARGNRERCTALTPSPGLSCRDSTRERGLSASKKAAKLYLQITLKAYAEVKRWQPTPEEDNPEEEVVNLNDNDEEEEDPNLNPVLQEGHN
ncbi:hypothetical protein NDU88_001244 [Pleurodeles waltl]|uniref:Uncharacterized protein n=1 Tax=Pleurodeles waltl TaxID=8319 RepID=A0AAV7UTR8_PLEWA|nr:hypothetical protein NDU88_001244 [Pleurodeles waltl]